MRVSRSGLQIRSSSIPIMGTGKDKQSPKLQVSKAVDIGTASTGTGTSQDGDIVICSIQDIWGFITSMQATMMKQSEDIKNLALKNQELEHKLQIQDMKLLQQEEQLQVLKVALNTQTTKTADALATHDEKFTHMYEKSSQNVSGNVVSWANAVRNGQLNPATTDINDDMYGNEAETEYMEQEKRKINIVIRGVPEKDQEQVLTLNADITDIISSKFGMHDVVVYGAHRVGKKKPKTNRAIVCTLLDARKRTIILENARIYLKDSSLYISEDRTPNQQKARRAAYEARVNKKTPPTKAKENQETREPSK